MEKILLATPEVESTSRRTGLQLGLAAVTEANSGDISVKLKAKRSRGVDEVIADMREQGCEEASRRWMWSSRRVLQDMIGDLTGAPEPIVIKLFSRDPELLREWAPRVADAHQERCGAWWTLKDGIENTIERAGDHFPGESGDGGAQRIHAGGGANWTRRRFLDGEPAPHAGDGQRPRLHHAGALSGGESRRRWKR